MFCLAPAAGRKLHGILEGAFFIFAQLINPSPFSFFPIGGKNNSTPFPGCQGNFHILS
jgi:hypothetical protein